MKNSSVFRKASLDRLASPEQLDRLLQVTRPRGWIALVALGFLVGSAVLWGFEGSIPSRVAGQGILLKSGGVLEIAAGAGGRITDVAVNVGDVVREGQVVARVAQPDVLNRIRQVRLALDNLRIEHRLVTTHSEEEVALQLAQLGQRREGLEQSISAAVDSLRWQREKIAAQQQLVDQGRLTRQTVINSRQEMHATEERLRTNRQQLAELRLDRLVMEARNARILQTSEHQVAKAMVELEQLEREMKNMSEIVSTFTGRIIEIMAERGDVAAPGQPLLRLDRTGRTVQRLEAVIYVPSAHGKRIRAGMEVRRVRLFFVEDFSPYSWALLPANASLQWPFRGGRHQAGQRVPASFRQPAEPRHGAEHLRSSPRQARSLLDIRAAFWYGAVGREADLRWL